MGEKSIGDAYGSYLDIFQYIYDSKLNNHLFIADIKKIRDRMRNFGGKFKMEQIGNTYYQAAYELFEKQQYEEAVENFIKAYECGVQKDEILENLYACFVVPNEAEFRKNYEENSKGNLDVPYEELEIDFIPVSDSKFYLFHRISKVFLGSFQLDEEPIMTDDVEFESILVADCWDFRKMLPTMKEKTWSIVYILLNEQEARFASFLKLPRFRELYMKNVIVFENTDIMKDVFEQYPDFYLPKHILSVESDYDAIFAEIHKKRIEDLSQERKNVFLSILIPSYNRGHRALSAVKEICRSTYDSEIEIVVSDNGSTSYVEEYQAIRDMKDARVRYHQYEKNMGLLENVVKVLELAQGKYAVLSSDEDMMLIDNLPHYMNVFQKNKDCGVFHTSGMYGNFGLIKEETVKSFGVMALKMGINGNYITGIGYNMQLARQLKLTEFIRKHMDNIMVEFYPHCVMSFNLALVSGVLQCGQPPLWLAMEAEDVDEASAGKIKSYMTIDSRERQYVDTVKLYIEAGIRGRVLGALYMERCCKFLMLLHIANVSFPAYYEERLITWKDMLEDALERCKKNLMLVENYVSAEERKQLVESIDNLYLEFKNK